MLTADLKIYGKIQVDSHGAAKKIVLILDLLIHISKYFVQIFNLNYSSKIL